MNKEFGKDNFDETERDDPSRRQQAYSSAPASEYDTEEQRGLDPVWLIQDMLRQTPKALGLGVIAALIAFLIILGVRYWNYSTTYQYVAALTFSGREEGQYPNGSPFRVADIIAPAIVSKVYFDNNLGDQDISLNDFQNAVNVTPYAADRRAIVLKYDAIFDERKSTLAELEESQRAMSQELQRRASNAVSVTFDNSRDNLPAEIAAKIPVALIDTWSEKAIQERGVVRTDIASVRVQSIRMSAMQNLEPLNLLRRLRERIDALRAYVGRLADLPGGDIIVDDDSGLNVSGLRTELDDVETTFIELPVGWSKNIVGNPEIQRLPINLFSSRILDADAIEGMDYLVALDVLSDKVGLIRKNLNSILDQQYGGVVIDPVSGLTAYDIDGLLDQLETFQLDRLRNPIVELGVARDPDGTRLYYRARTKQLIRSKALLQSKSEVLDQAITQSANEGLVSAPANAGSNSVAGSTTVIPQLGSDFIDRLIELSNRGGEEEFRQSLLRQKVDLQQQLADVDSEIGRIEDYTRAIERAPSDESAGLEGGTSKATKELIDRVQSGVPVIVDTLRNYADVTVRIAQRLRYAREIHSIVEQGKENPAVDVDYYLRDRGGADPSAEDIVASLRSVAEVAARINGQIDSQTVGTAQLLYRPLGEVERVRPPLLTTMQFIIMALAGLLVFFAALSLYTAGDMMRNAIAERRLKAKAQRT